MSRVAGYLLGQAQRSFHDVAEADHPRELMKAIAPAALQDAGVSAPAVDAIACIDCFSWTYADLGKSVASDIGCRDDVREFWLPGGGTTPQDLLHQITASMAEGEIDVALLFGAEAMRTRRKATRAGRELNWPPRDKSVNPMRGQKPFTSEWEAQHGLRLPIQLFPMNENAIRHANGRSAEEQIAVAANILHRNAQVAANNPNAWFRDAPSAETIGTVTADNRMIAYPYTKRMNAIMDVDQSAALVLVSDRYLEAHGGRERAAAVLGGAGAEEIWNPSQRHDLSRSVPMELAFGQALASAGLSVDDIDAFDFYSCFPAPIQMALAALGLSHEDDRPLSITGGLAYAGGPGNNYVSHSLATALQRLRANPDERLMVTGVGMANTKQTATVLCNAMQVPAQAKGETVYRLETGETPIPLLERIEGPATIVTYTIEYDREGQAARVIYLLDVAGGRAIANAREAHSDTQSLLEHDPIGRGGTLTWDAADNLQYFTLS